MTHETRNLIILGVLLALCVLAPTIFVFTFTAAVSKKADVLTKENEFLRYSFGRYMIANSKNYALHTLKGTPEKYDAISNDFKIPVGALWSMSEHENISDGFTFGVKRIPRWIANKYPPELWQAAAAANIISDEMADYIFKDKDRRDKFFIYLGVRYCHWDKNWGTSVGKIYTNKWEAGDK